MGGQEGDKGVIELGDAQFVVEDTIKLRGGKVGLSLIHIFSACDLYQYGNVSERQGGHTGISDRI